MTNAKNIEELYISILKKSVKGKSAVDIQPCIDRFLEQILTTEALSNILTSQKRFYIFLRTAQATVENETHIKNTIRDSLIRRCKKNGGDVKKLLRELYYNLPTEEELEKQHNDEEKYHIIGKAFTARILDVKAESSYNSSCVTGISKEKQAQYTTKNGFFGSNGTYRVGYPDVERHLFLVVKLKGHPHIKIDVREKVLSLNDRQRVTDSFVQSLKEKLCDNEIKIIYKGKDKFGEHVFSVQNDSFLCLDKSIQNDKQ
jgi:hypothetical protein